MSKPLTYLVIHCTATPEGREVTAEEIRRWHTSPPPKGRGWKQVGYSDLIHLDGIIENLVPYNNDDIVDVWEITNGASGVNSVSRHVVYAGGVSADDVKKARDTRTWLQELAMITYVKETIARHPNIKVAGHNQFNSGKACPSFDVPSWCRKIGIPEKNIYKG
jgi:N-acetylmuramoyl-L-alanine amidase